MVIRLDENYNAMTSTALLGYVGETNARPVSVEGMEIDGADRYVLTIDYGDGTVYEVDITDGTWTPTADILRSAQTVSCQICAKKLSGDEYILVKKSRIFRLRIGAAIGDTAIPSPSVAADALDMISAIGEQVEADVERAENAASTAMQAAENAKKSATNAEKSADTAEQAASRAETAKTAAETSAAQSETARQGAENARQQAVTSQNAAKVSAAQAATSAQQTTADKNITAGYAQTAKTNADNTATDRQAVQTLAEQVTADKATVAENAAKVATDRKATETAAQTAQSVADSLPDDYTTAVGKIAENTAEISAVKLTDKELQRRVNALYSIGQGITHQFETDSETAYAKTVPTGGKLMSVKNVGGRSIVWNQLCDTVLDNFSDTVSAAYNEYGICKFTANVGDKICVYSGGVNGTYAANGAYVAGFMGSAYFEFFGKQIVQCTENGNCIIYLRLRGNGNTYSNVSVRPEFFNLTKMFGAGNEPTSVEEFEKMFPADYYPYNAGEIVSAGVTEVAVGDTAHQIPEAIKALPGYGWSAGTAKNYVDYENKQYHQCVDSVDLGTLNWGTVSGYDNSFRTVPPRKKGGYNMICTKYNVSNNSLASIPDKSMTANAGDGNTYVKDSSYSDAATFKQAMQGVILYYELEKPIVTDISTLIPDDFLRNMTVESGGSITFKGGNGDSYRIPVPSEEEYIVKLSEVGGTT